MVQAGESLTIKGIVYQRFRDRTGLTSTIEGRAQLKVLDAIADLIDTRVGGQNLLSILSPEQQATFLNSIWRNFLKDYKATDFYTEVKPTEGPSQEPIGTLDVSIARILNALVNRAFNSFSTSSK